MKSGGLKRHQPEMNFTMLSVLILHVSDGKILPPMIISSKTKQNKAKGLYQLQSDIDQNSYSG